MASSLLFPLLFFSLALASTPDCFNLTEGVTTIWPNLGGALPLNLNKHKLDLISLKPGKNCAFYTFNDVHFSSFHPSVSGIYFNFVNSPNSTTGAPQCKLESTKINTFQTGTWLYANSSMAPENICGYYVGIANADTQKELLF